MIEVKDLVRRFGEAEAVSHVSFQVERGDIVGFLGPNGAGKTTTLRMITGFLPPTSGEVVVEGKSSASQGKEVRRLIGYLPENNPLYEDLRVREYLDFRAELKGLPRKGRRGRVDEVLEATGATEVAGKLVGACSKGFRQRVGLADALLADPPFLILDEPTVGLDPVQIVQTRELIRTLGRDRTVLLSTHILPEVEAICTRALILYRGRLLYDGSVEGLRRGLGRGGLLVRLAAPASGAEEALSKVPGVLGLRKEAETPEEVLWEVETEKERDVRGALFTACAQAGLVLLEMAPRQVSLEEAFLALTTAESLEEVPR